MRPSGDLICRTLRLKRGDMVTKHRFVSSTIQCDSVFAPLYPLLHSRYSHSLSGKYLHYHLTHGISLAASIEEACSRVASLSFYYQKNISTIALLMAPLSLRLLKKYTYSWLHYRFTLRKTSSLVVYSHLTRDFTLAIANYR